MESMETVVSLIPFMIIIGAFVAIFIGLYTSYLTTNEMIYTSRQALSLAETTLARCGDEPGVVKPDSACLGSVCKAGSNCGLKIECAVKEADSNYDAVYKSEKTKAVVGLPTLVKVGDDKVPGKLTAVVQRG